MPTTSQREMNTTSNHNQLKAQLIADFHANEGRMNGEAKSPLHQTRRDALQQFDKLGFPSIKHEEWKYSNVKSMVGQAFNFASAGGVTLQDVEDLKIPNLEGNILYFVNGVFHPELSNIISPESQLQILNFKEAYQQFPAIVEAHFAQYADYSDNAFTALNTAFANHGVFIHVPDKAVVEQPIICRFVADARQENVAAQPRNLIIVGKRAEVKMAESFRSLGDNAAFTNIVTEVFVGEEAHFEYYKVQNESDQSYHIGTTQIVQHARSHAYCVTVSVNGGFIRNNLNIKLNGEHCDAHMYGVYLPNGKQHIDNHTVVDHAKPNAESTELYKGILADRSTGVFNGKIFVREDAQKTNAYQSCRNVVLSDDATMNTKPQLEIWADDVKCSHGTTTGKLDDEALFYMQARGIRKEAALALLMFAFAEDVVEKIRIPAIKEYLEGLIEEKIEKLK
jgi:Fe-S cluster assembly protein SufD